MYKYSYTIGYIVLNALSVVIINFVGHKIPVDLMIAISSFYALLFFHAVNYRKIPTLYRKVRNNFQLYVKTIVVFLIMWLVCFLVPIYYTPAILMFFATAWPACFGAFKKYKQTKDNSARLLAITIFFIIAGFYFALYKKYSVSDYVLLALGTLTAGLTMFMYSKLSYDMNQAGFNPSEILAVRFILLFLLPLIWSFKTGSILHINLETVLLTLLLSFASLIVPIYCSQISILKIGPNSHSIAIGLTPFVAFVFEYFYLKSHHGVTLDGYFSGLLFLALIFANVKRLYRKRMIR